MKTMIINLDALLNRVTRDDLRNIAKHLNVPVGKSKSDTIANVIKAMENQKVRLTSTVSITIEKPMDKTMPCGQTPKPMRLPVLLRRFEDK